MKKFSLLILLASIMSFNVSASPSVNVETCSRIATEEVQSASQTTNDAPLVFKPIALGGEIMTAATGLGYVVVCGSADAIETASRFTAREIKEAYKDAKELAKQTGREIKDLSIRGYKKVRNSGVVNGMVQWLKGECKTRGQEGYEESDCKVE